MKCAIAVLFTALVLSGCSSMQVAPDWDYDEDFSSYQTFAWIQESGSSEGDQLPEHLDIRLRRVVEDVMMDKGFDIVPVQPMADLLVGKTYDSLLASVEEGSYIGLHAVGDTKCHHLLFRQESCLTWDSEEVRHCLWIMIRTKKKLCQ